MKKQKVIYDFGMNNGDDLPYYLKKAEKVVGVEANPALCSLVEKRFADYISNGNLIIVNCILSDKDTNLEADFYIHKTKHVLSQFPRPHNSIIERFEIVKLPQRTASSIILEYGEPLYIKIDIEHYDKYILQDICSKHIKPAYISVEAHDFIVYEILKNMGYKVFNIVVGKSVSKLYQDVPIVDYLGNTCNYSFPPHSAGPYGHDVIKSPWMKTWQMNIFLKGTEPGWKDIHASLEDLSKGEFGWGLLKIWPTISRKLRHKFKLRTRLSKIFQGVNKVISRK